MLCQHTLSCRLLSRSDCLCFLFPVQERPQRFTITAVSPVVRILSISVKDVRAHIASKTVTNLIRVAKKQDSLRVHLVGSVLDARRQLAEKRRETVVGSEVRMHLSLHRDSQWVSLPVRTPSP